VSNFSQFYFDFYNNVLHQHCVMRLRISGACRTEVGNNAAKLFKPRNDLGVFLGDGQRDIRGPLVHTLKANASCQSLVVAAPDCVRETFQQCRLGACFALPVAALLDCKGRTRFCAFLAEVAGTVPPCARTTFNLHFVETGVRT